MVCSHLKLQYPRVIFRTDFGAGLKLSIGQAIAHKNLQSDRAYPDLFLAEPRGNFHGLYLELKREGVRVYLKNGELTSDEHIREQAHMINRLNDLGYLATFAIGFDDAAQIIKEYMALPKSP